MDNIDIKYYTKPWSYAVVDNFLPQDVFKELVEYCKEIGVDTPVSKTVNTILPKELDKKITYQTRLFKDLAFDTLNTSNKIIEKERINYTLQFREPGHNYPIHSDIWSKVFSLVLYIYPFKGQTGTKIFTMGENPEFVTEVEWKPNRLVAFVPSNNPLTKTNHSVENFTEFNRAALVINYLTYDPSNEY